LPKKQEQELTNGTESKLKVPTHQKKQLPESRDDSQDERKSSLAIQQIKDQYPNI
jgi:hypothetical protein